MLRFNCLQIAAFLSLVILCKDSAAQSKPPEPLKTAWKDLVATDEQAAKLDAMTSVRRYDQQMKAISAAQKSAKGKTFSVRLRVTGVIEPTQADRLMLVHGQYADQEYRKNFGDSATVGIWTADYKTALQLSVGDEIELRGKIFYEVHYVDADIARVPSLWKQQAINTSVALLSSNLTHWVREARIYMVNPTIVRLPKQ